MMKATTHSPTTATPRLSGGREDRSHCLTCAIRHQAVCAHCSGPELDLLSDIKAYREVRAGGSIVGAGERTNFLGSVVEGVAAMSRLLADGRRQVVGLLLPGDFIGRPFSPVAPFDLTAITPVRLCTFSRPRFEELVRQMPALEHRLLEMTLDELDSAREWMVLLGRKSAQERVTSFLMRFVPNRGVIGCGGPQAGGDEKVVVLRMTRQEIADYLGLTIETVSRVLSDLKRRGIISIEKNDRIRLADVCRVCRLTGTH